MFHKSQLLNKCNITVEPKLMLFFTIWMRGWDSLRSVCCVTWTPCFFPLVRTCWVSEFSPNEALLFQGKNWQMLGSHAGLMLDCYKHSDLHVWFSAISVIVNPELSLTTFVWKRRYIKISENDGSVNVTSFQWIALYKMISRAPITAPRRTSHLDSLELWTITAEWEVCRKQLWPAKDL